MGVIKHLDELPLPRKDDVLFKLTAPLSTLWYSMLGASDIEAYDLGYANGYLSAARALVEHMKVRKGNFVFPIIFLYRHHIELVLKNIIRRSPYLLGRPLTETEAKNLNNTHQLELLWKDLKPLFGEFCELAGWGTLPTAEEEAIDSYVKQITEFDRDFASRYPRSKKDKPTLDKDFNQFDLLHFAEMMERLAYYLDGLDSASLDLVDTKREWEGSNCL
jgi:hypothetical protein